MGSFGYIVHKITTTNIPTNEQADRCDTKKMCDESII